MGGCAADQGAAGLTVPPAPLFASRNRETTLLARTLAVFAVSDLAMLVEGETGTGKSTVARMIHRRSRPGTPLVVADCGAWPAALAPAELFGHVAGAFTDATRSRVGWLEQAGDGTLVLDRLEALAPEAQVALLRTVEECRFLPVGGRTPRLLRARIVCLADSGLRERVASGVVREDLYFRLAGFHAVLPPLRNRPEDILPAARAELRRQGRLLSRRFRISAQAEELLHHHPWPGNFRQLRAVVAGACLRASDEDIGPAELGLDACEAGGVLDVAARRPLSLAAASRLYALLVLSSYGGNVSRAARVLGVSRRTLIRWRQE